MARRNETILDILALCPWWVSVAASCITYSFLQFIIPSITLSSPVLAGIPKLGPMFAPWVALLLLLPAPISLFNSIRKKRLLDKQKNIQSIRDLSWKQFEELVGEAYRRQGYTVLENEGAGPDGGVDLWLRKDGNQYLVQCKQWKTLKVGVKVVREMYGLVTAHNASGSIIITSGLFTQEAKAFARDKPLDLVEGQQLVAMIDLVKNSPAPNTERVVSPGELSQNEAQAAPICPACSATMILRTAKKGAAAGQQFWGCSNYPRCKGIRNFS
ncbi:MAG: restriction endonuclease [Desulfobulbus sp.]|nr:restriction endonuclease [Desulfobulbus sp.]